jgi:hypothetical protein
MMNGRAGETPTGEALAMLSAFASVGARAFDLTLTEIERVNIPGGFKRNRSVAELRRTIGRILSDAERDRHNVIIRPHSTTATLIQLDDLDTLQVEQLERHAFMVLLTSPRNFQAWVAVKDAPTDADQAKDFIRRLRKGIGGADKSATGATRIAGSLNFKTKYAPAFPLVKLMSRQLCRVTTVGLLERAGFVAAEEPSAPPRVPPHNLSSRNAVARKWPNYQQTLSGAPPKSDGSQDRSMADFMWSKWAIERGWSIKETAEKLVEVSAKAQENARRGDEGYAEVTARNAADAVEKRHGPKPIKSTPSPPK